LETIWRRFFACRTRPESRAHVTVAEDHDTVSRDHQVAFGAGVEMDPDLEELGITVDATTVLRRTPAFTGDTARIAPFVIGRLEAFMHENALPVVTEVAGIHRRWRVPASPIEESRQRHFPSGHDRPVNRVVVSRNAD